MFRHGDISTQVDRGPFIFSLIAFAGSSVTSWLILVFAKGSPLGLWAVVLLAIVGLAALVSLFGMLTDYACIENGILHMHYLFRDRTIALKDIKRLEFKDNIYTVYDRHGSKVGTINALLTGIDEVIHELDRNRITIC